MNLLLILLINFNVEPAAITDITSVRLTNNLLVLVEGFDSGNASISVLGAIATVERGSNTDLSLPPPSYLGK